MTHYGPGSKCPGCAVKKGDLNPTLRVWLEEVQNDYPDAHVSYTFRGEKEQHEAFLNGSSNRDWPDSKHNIMIKGKPCAEAFDLFQLTKENRAVYPPKFFVDIAYKLMDWAAPVKWGGHFPKPDSDHYELDRLALEGSHL